MGIFEKVRVQGFRRLNDMDLKLKPLNLAEWLHEYSLDELWRIGKIGGRP